MPPLRGCVSVSCLGTFTRPRLRHLRAQDTAGSAFDAEWPFEAGALLRQAGSFGDVDDGGAYEIEVGDGYPPKAIMCL